MHRREEESKYVPLLYPEAKQNILEPMTEHLKIQAKMTWNIQMTG